MFRYHLDHEEDYHANYSAADIALISPRETYWSKSELSFPGEYYGWYHLLTQQHYIFDCIKMNAVKMFRLKSIRRLYSPDVQDRSDAGAKKLMPLLRPRYSDCNRGNIYGMNGRNARPSALRASGVENGVMSATTIFPLTLR